MAQQRIDAEGGAFVAFLLNFLSFISSHGGSSGWQVNCPNSHAVAGEYVNEIVPRFGLMFYMRPPMAPNSH